MRVLIICSLILAGANTASTNSTSNEVIPNGRITWGKYAAFGKFPYHVLINNKESNSSYLTCGGSIISNKWVLTAAHCLRGLKTADVYLGITVFPNSEIKYEITPGDIILHPDWHRRLANDIALIRIPRTEFSKRIQPIKLPPLNGSKTNYVRQSAVLTGLGEVENGTYPKILQWARFKIIRNDECQRWYLTKIESTHICVSSLNFVSACSGDSGGPLVLSSSHVQIGIFSFYASGSCQDGYPNVYTRITSFLQWIKNCTGISY